MKIPAGKSFVTFLFFCLCAISIGTFTACDAPKSDKEETNNKPDDGADGGEDDTNEDGTDGETDGETDGNTDGTVDPTELTGVYVESVTMPENKEYLVGDEISFALNFTDNVDVEGTPTITFFVGPTTTQQTTEVTASYASGTGTKTLTFTYTVAGGHLSPFGLKQGDEPVIDLAGGTLSSTDEVNLSLVNFGDTSKIKIIEGLQDDDGAYRFHDGSAAESCTAYVKDQRYADAGSGVYWLKNPEDDTTDIKGVCDMDYENGWGWLLVLNYVFQNANYSDPVNELSNALPIIPDNTAWGDDQSDDMDAWGHAPSSLVAGYEPDTFRYRCEFGPNGGEATVLSFKVQQAICDTANQQAGSGGEADSCTDGNLLEKYTPDADSDATPTGNDPLTDMVIETGEMAMYYDLTATPKSFDASSNWVTGNGNWLCEGSMNTDDYLFQAWIRN